MQEMTTLYNKVAFVIGIVYPKMKTYPLAISNLYILFSSAEQIFKKMLEPMTLQGHSNGQVP